MYPKAFSFSFTTGKDFRFPTWKFNVGFKTLRMPKHKSVHKNATVRFGLSMNKEDPLTSKIKPLDVYLAANLELEMNVHVTPFLK